MFQRNCPTLEKVQLVVAVISFLVAVTSASTSTLYQSSVCKGLSIGLAVVGAVIVLWTAFWKVAKRRQPHDPDLVQSVQGDALRQSQIDIHDPSRERSELRADSQPTIIGSSNTGPAQVVHFPAVELHHRDQQDGIRARTVANRTMDGQPAPRDRSLSPPRQPLDVIPLPPVEVHDRDQQGGIRACTVENRSPDSQPAPRDRSGSPPRQPLDMIHPLPVDLHRRDQQDGIGARSNSPPRQPLEVVHPPPVELHDRDQLDGIRAHTMANQTPDSQQAPRDRSGSPPRQPLDVIHPPPVELHDRDQQDGIRAREVANGTLDSQPAPRDRSRSPPRQPLEVVHPAQVELHHRDRQDGLRARTVANRTRDNQPGPRDRSRSPSRMPPELTVTKTQEVGYDKKMTSTATLYRNGNLSVDVLTECNNMFYGLRGRVRVIVRDADNNQIGVSEEIHCATRGGVLDVFTQSSGRESFMLTLSQDIGQRAAALDILQWEETKFGAPKAEKALEVAQIVKTAWKGGI